MSTFAAGDAVIFDGGKATVTEVIDAETYRVEWLDPYTGPRWKNVNMKWLEPLPVPPLIKVAVSLADLHAEKRQLEARLDAVLTKIAEARGERL